MKAEKSNRHLYNPILQPYGRRLRNKGTKAEACLWKYVLRAGLMKGYEFRRQRPVLWYIADFMCFNLKLVIEVDGGYHLSDEAIEHDRVRDQALTEAGFTLLRFTNQEVLHHIVKVRQQIEWWIEAREEANGVCENIAESVPLTRNTGIPSPRLAPPA